MSWRGDLGGNFAGADPLLTWDGFEGKGLVWRTPMPNWAGCGCIVVGKRVITRASPSTLLCYDADTGKRLWYDKTDVFDYHFKEDPKQAQEMRVLLSKWQRQRGLGWGEQGKGRLRPWTAEERDEWIALTKELVASHPHWFRFGKTGGRKLLEKDEFLARLDQPYPTEFKDIMAVYQQIRVTASPFEFWKLGIAENKYNNSEDATISTPCSDGKYVYTANAHNLITCHDIETGKVRWMVWTGMPRAQPVQGNEFWPSPWIFGGKLIVYNNYALRAFDPDTGEQLWVDDYYEVAAERGRLPTRGEYAAPKYASLEYPPFATGHDHAVNCAFLTIGDTPVVVTSIGTVVRISDGKRLARLPDADMDWSGNTWVPHDDQRDIVVIDNGRQTGGNNERMPER